MLERAASFYKAPLFPSFILDISGFFMSLCGLLYSFFPLFKTWFELKEKCIGYVPWLQTNSDLCCRSSLLTLWVCRWLANSIGTGWGKGKKKKKSYKPALCVLGSSTVYFYCTWSINLSIDLCCHYFLILCLSVFYAYEMRVMHCFNLCEWPLVCVRDKPAEGCQMHWMLLWIKMSIPFLCKLLCDNSAA